MVPAHILKRVQYHIHKINNANAAIMHARGMGSSGRYEWEYRVTNHPDLSPSIEFFAQFENVAAENGVDAQAVYAELGGKPEPLPWSDEALAWVN